MHLDKGFVYLRSWAGAICSIILFTLIGAYALQKFDILVRIHDVDLVITTNMNALSEHDQFDSSMGFNIAAAIMNYYGENEPIDDDPTIGELVFIVNSWGRYDNG